MLRGGRRDRTGRRAEPCGRVSRALDKPCIVGCEFIEIDLAAGGPSGSAGRPTGKAISYPSTVRQEGFSPARSSFRRVAEVFRRWPAFSTGQTLPLAPSYGRQPDQQRKSSSWSLLPVSGSWA